MATQLYNIVRFTAVAGEASAQIAHGLNVSDLKLVPDWVAWANAGFTVDDTFVTVTNARAAHGGREPDRAYHPGLILG